MHVRFWERVGVRFPRATCLPLYHLSRIFARDGIELDRSTLAVWVGKATALLEPQSDAIGRHVLEGTRRHGFCRSFRFARGRRTARAHHEAAPRSPSHGATILVSAHHRQQREHRHLPLDARDQPRVADVKPKHIMNFRYRDSCRTP